MRRYFNHHVTLTDFAEHFHLDPFFVAGFSGCGNGYTDCNCDQSALWLEYDNPNYLSREAVSQALYEAEIDIMVYLGYPVAPTPRQDVPIIFNSLGWKRPNGRYKTLITPDAYLIRFGKQVMGSAIVGIVDKTDFSASTRYGFMEITATVPANTTAEQIRMYHAPNERLTDELNHWRIEPITVLDINATTWLATIKVPAYLLAVPDLLLDDQGLDRTILTNYVDEVELRVFTWVTTELGLAYGYNCDNVEQSEALDFAIPDPELGIVEFKPVEPCINDGLVAPYRAVVHYETGYPRMNGRVAPAMRQAVIMLAASRLTCQLPSCRCRGCRVDQVEAMRHVSKELVSEGSEAGVTGDTYRLLRKIDGEPEWGLFDGAYRAWSKVRTLRVERDEHYGKQAGY